MTNPPTSPDVPDVATEAATTELWRLHPDLEVYPEVSDTVIAAALAAWPEPILVLPGRGVVPLTYRCGFCAGSGLTADEYGNEGPCPTCHGRRRVLSDEVVARIASDAKPGVPGEDPRILVEFGKRVLLALIDRPADA